ncbi:MAG TPA: flagellar hook-basal body complex protein FliE [Spirochaetota bacterium]|nr:flagellar hook-basal body complex protein FliE [Spirochaetota bacterium]
MNTIDTTFTGHLVGLKTTNPLHMDGFQALKPDDDVAGSFADMLKSAVNKLNDLQIDAEDLSQKMIHEPGSVDIHTVMIATQKAELALTFTKAVRDEAIRSYRELMNLR